MIAPKKSMKRRSTDDLDTPIPQKRVRVEGNCPSPINDVEVEVVGGVEGKDGGGVKDDDVKDDDVKDDGAGEKLGGEYLGIENKNAQVLDMSRRGPSLKKNIYLLDDKHFCQVGEVMHRGSRTFSFESLVITRKGSLKGGVMGKPFSFNMPAKLVRPLLNALRSMVGESSTPTNTIDFAPFE